MFGRGGYLPRNVENGSTVNIAKVHVLDSVCLNFAQSPLKPLITTSKKQANKMQFSGSNGSCSLPDTIYALMHLQKPSSDSDRRQALAFHNEVVADIFIFSFGTYLVCFNWLLGNALGDPSQSTDTVVLWNGGGCRQKHFLFKLEWQWGKVRRRLIRNNKAYTHDPMGKLQFSSLLSFLFLALLLFSWGLPSLRYGVFFLLYYIA